MAYSDMSRKSQDSYTFLPNEKTRQWGGEMNKKVTLACTICSSRNYTTTKNVSTQPTRLEVRKYCKTCGKHTLHRETK